MFLNEIFERYGDGKRIKFTTLYSDGNEIKVKNGVVLNELPLLDNPLNKVIITFNEIEGNRVSIKSKLDYFHIYEDTNETELTFSIDKEPEEIERNKYYKGDYITIVV